MAKLLLGWFTLQKNQFQIEKLLDSEIFNYETFFVSLKKWNSRLIALLIGKVFILRPNHPIPA